MLNTQTMDSFFMNDVCPQSKFTAKGVEWVAGEYAKSLVRDATKV